MEIFVESCKRQYRQTFAMLRQAAELCPDELWTAGEEVEPPFWQQLYHTLLVTQAYASGSFADIRSELTDRVLKPRPPEPGEPPWRPMGEKIKQLMEAGEAPFEVMGREQMLAYLDEVKSSCDASLDRDAGMDPADPDANPFAWTGKTSYDKHIYNLRHLHHHLGRLNGLLRSRANIGNPWVTESSEPDA